MLKKYFKTYINYYLTVVAIVISASLTACRDDFDYGYGEINGSEIMVDVTLEFDSETAVELSTRASGGTNGNAIQNINSLWMVVYDENKKLIDNPIQLCKEGQPNKNLEDISNISIEIEKKETTEQENENSPISTIPSTVSYCWRTKSARYYIYAVANFDLTGKDVSTPDKLKSLKADWDNTSVINNSEMFGVFTANEPSTEASNVSKVFIGTKDTEQIAVTNKTFKLYSRLNRLASKVTVAFDGSKLYDNVQVFIESITIKDIPRECYLGRENTPGRKSSDAPDNEIADSKLRRDSLWTSGEKILISDEEFNFDAIVPNDFSSEADWHICNEKHPNLGYGSENNSLEETHSHEAVSLFFYENRQGMGKDKRQDSNGDGIPDYINPKEDDLESGWKDHKPYGSYIEVVGYYKCNTLDSSVGHGKIIYRFMLGQDVETDYNANRNTHYKLTLQLKGYGNDADWHIEYKEEPGIYMSSPIYISYLYNMKTNLSFKIVGDVDNGTLYASIEGTENYEADFPSEAKFAAGSSPNGERPTYWRPWGDKANYPQFSDPADGDEYGNSSYSYNYSGNDGPWTSFLSLRPYNRVRVDDPKLNGLPSYLGSATTPELQYQWEDHKSGWATYDISSNGVKDPGMSGMNKDTGKYQVSITGSGSTKRTMVTLPIYTRPKELITKTGFSGNNPYFAYARKARLKVSASFNGVWKHSYVDIIQVPRVENPTAVWRDTSTEPFHVELMYSSRDNSDYQPLISYGKWSAEVVGTPGVISLTTTPDGSGPDLQRTNASRIEGDSEHPVDFMINFTGMKGMAIVKVRYNNYNCEHRIFCRMGYDDTQLLPHGPTWSLYNVYAFDGDAPIPTRSPLEEGSYFRRGSFNAILASNHVRTDGNYGFPGNGFWTPTNSFWVLKNDGQQMDMSWESLMGDNRNESLEKDWTVSGDYHISTIDEFYTLTEIPGVENDSEKANLTKGYGIIYGDGATLTQKKREKATGYNREDADDAGGSEKGMRGVIIYNNQTYAQIFLPIGAVGYGRMKGFTPQWLLDIGQGDANATLRYASRPTYNPSSEQPMFYDLFKRPGAIYWCQKRYDADVFRQEYDNPYSNSRDKYTDVTKSCDFDINYFTTGFEGFANEADNPATKDLGDGVSDACFIRLVRN